MDTYADKPSSMQLLKNGRNHFIMLWLLFFAYAIGLAYWLHQDTSPPLPDQSNIFLQSLRHYDLLTEKPVYQAMLGVFTEYHYYPPLVPFISSLFYLVFGTGSDVAVLSTLLFLGLLFWSVFSLGKYLSGEGAGLLATFLTVTSPIIIGYSREFWVDVPVIGMLMAFLYLLVRSNNFQNSGYSIGLGVVCGLGMLTKWNFVFFAVGPLAITLWLIYKDSWPSWKVRILIVLSAGIIICTGILVYMLLSHELRILAKIFMFTSVLLIGVSIVPVIWQRIKPLIPWHVLGPLQLSGAIGLSWLNMLRVIIIALILCGPWYLTNISVLRSDFKLFAVTYAVVEGDPPQLSVPSLMYGFWNILNGQLFLPIGLLAFIGLFWVLWKRSSHKGWLLLIAYFVIGYLILTIIPNKSHRYTMPLIPVALIAASAWVYNQRNAIRHLLVTAAVVVGLIQYFALNYGCALVDQTISIPLPHSKFTEYREFPPEIVIYSTAERMYTDLEAYYSHPPLKEDWPLDKILETVRNDSTESEPSLVVAVDKRFLHYFNLSYFSELKQWHVAVKRYEEHFDRFYADPENWTGTHYLLVLQNDPFLAEIKPLLEKEFSHLNVRTLTTWQLPDDSVVQLVRIDANSKAFMGT